MGEEKRKYIGKLSVFGKEPVVLSPFMQFSSNREVTVDGCKGIMEYCTESIKINTGKLIIAFNGRGLNIKCMTETSVIICGYITSVEFLR